MTETINTFKTAYGAAEHITSRLAEMGIDPMMTGDLSDAIKTKVTTVPGQNVILSFEVDEGKIDEHIEKARPLDERTLFVLHERIEKQLLTQNDLQITHNAEYARGRKNGLHEARIIIRHELSRARQAKK